MIPLLMLLAATGCLGLYLVVKDRLEHRGGDVSQLVVQRLENHLGPGPVSLREMEMEQPFADRVVRPLLRRGGDLFARTTPTRQRESLQVSINQAGRYSLDTGTFLIVRAGAALCLLLVGLMLGGLLGGGLLAIVLTILFAGIGYTLPLLWLKRLAKQRLKEMRRALPDVMDLLSITVQAGLSFDAALARVAERYRGTPVGQEFNQVLQEVRLGRPRLEALTALGQRSHVEEMQSFTQAVVQSEQMGIGIGKVLETQAKDVRGARIQHAKQKAGRSTLLMLLPMIGCIFPTLFIILLGPAVLAVLAMKLF
jgi:tight adherence protein C